MRVVLDANIYVSALLLQRGNAKEIMDLFEKKRIELLVSEPILEEVGRVLGYPHIARIHKQKAQQIEEYLASLKENADVIQPATTLHVSADEPDNRYIECAVEGNADVLVTGDKRHLLPIREYHGIQILSPAAFLLFMQVGAS
ncbi:MAG: putative toxin-antitoxin system toxin component, PIN family [Caldilineaceae bacterium]|nr:putative toxin-antitoxin system toxin component, PIN family [Caldilineaceae bacterium]